MSHLPPHLTLLSRNLTPNSGFHHITCKWLLPSQSKSGSTSSSSNLQKILAIIRLISTIAKLSSSAMLGRRDMCRRSQGETYLRPKQPRGPRENGWLASLISELSVSSHRSGLKSMGSGKLCSSCVTVQALVYTSVCMIRRKRQNEPRVIIEWIASRRLTPLGIQCPSTS